MRATVSEYPMISAVSESQLEAVYLADPPARLEAPSPVIVRVFTSDVLDERHQRIVEQLHRFATVESPHLAVLLDAGKERDRFYFVVESPPLGTLADPARPLSSEEVLRAVAQAARGAHALHEAGLAHRDICPARIMLHEDGARLGELDLARFVEAGITVTSSASAGAIEFLDPAIIRGERSSRSSDIWSLGATLHRALTGKSIYGEELPPTDLVNAVRRVLSTETAVDSSISPAAAGDVVRACLAPLAADRPPTALAVAEQIEALQ